MAVDWNSEDIRRVVDYAPWQKLRASLVGTWRKTPKENVKRLRAFLGSMTDERRLRIVHNYLTGTAFRLGVVSTPEVSKLRDQVRSARRKLKAKKQ